MLFLILNFPATDKILAINNVTQYADESCSNQFISNSSIILETPPPPILFIKLKGQGHKSEHNSLLHGVKIFDNTSSIQ